MDSYVPNPFIRRNCLFLRPLIGFLLLAVVLVRAASAQSGVPSTPPSAARKTAISAADFSRMVRTFSEEEGNFFSDNYVSNETSYLHVIDKLKQLKVTGGAYLGVGPEQNFTYIAKIRPEIAFIVDIRRQAIIQHLMYKAIFQMEPDPAHFLSLLLSKPLDRTTEGKSAPGPGAPIGELVEYFSEAKTPEGVYERNLAAIRKTIEKDFEIPLSERDQGMLEKVYRAFEAASMHISFRFAGAAGMFYGGFPDLADLVMAKDLNGKLGNFLASEQDYNVVRNLQRNNRIIPVVGDFAGTKALAVVADYLKENGYTLSAYYTSNVEEFLFGDRVYDAFAENIRQMPIDDRSVFIRALRGGLPNHPAHIPGHRMITVLQKMKVFLKDYDQGLLRSYSSLALTDYIAGNQP